jgi:phosphoglycolate phosphatase
MRLPAAVLFDLDGTLLDTSGDLARALNHCLSLRGREAIAPKRVKHLVGHGARALLAAGLSEQGHAPSELEISALVPDFLSYYAAHIAEDTHAYPGLLNVLDELKARGVAMGVCTNKPELLSHQVLAATGLTNYFLAVVGGDSLDVRKPDPEHLWATHRAMGATGSAIMVGDSDVDIRAAHAASMPIVAVSFGFATVPVATFGPDKVIGHFDELLTAMDEIMQASAF